jgi:hypothetical protein
MLRPRDPKENPCASAGGASVIVSKPIASTGAASHLMSVDIGCASVDDMGLIREPASARDLGLPCQIANSVPMNAERQGP